MKFPSVFACRLAHPVSFFVQFYIGRKVVMFMSTLVSYVYIGCLINVYGQRAVYDAGHGIGPKLDSIIKNGSWYWPSARSDAIVAIQRRLPEVELGGLDQAIWDSKSGQFSSA